MCPSSPFLDASSEEVNGTVHFFTSSSSFQIISAQSVSAESVKTLGPFVPGIWSQLFKHCECQEEGTRNVVAECLGKLCLIEPEKLLGELRRALTAPSALLRTTVVTCKSDAYRFPIDLGNFSHSLPMLGRQVATSAPLRLLTW